MKKPKLAEKLQEQHNENLCTFNLNCKIIKMISHNMYVYTHAYFMLRHWEVVIDTMTMNC